MKKTLKLIAMCLMIGSLSVSCGGDDEPAAKPDGEGGTGQEQGGGDEGESGNAIPNIVFNEKMTGTAEYGVEISLNIKGADMDLDDVVIKYKTAAGETGEQVLKVDDETLRITPKVIVLGFDVNSPYLDGSAKVYLRRPGYDLYALSDEIRFTKPTDENLVYLDNVLLRERFRDVYNCPEAATCFTAYGMLDKNLAKNTPVSLDLGGCEARTLDGIEYFETLKNNPEKDENLANWGFTKFVLIWGMPNLEEVDLSNWKAKGAVIHANNCPKLKKFVGGKYFYQYTLVDNESLQEVDVHNGMWLRCVLLNDKSKNSIKTLDIHRQYPSAGNDNLEFNAGICTKDNEICSVWNGADQGFMCGKQATIKIDSWFLVDHGEPQWKQIVDSWKEGATIEVYAREWSRDGIGDNKLIGTVPSYKDQPNALKYENRDTSRGDHYHYVPANEWHAVDPSTPDYHEYHTWEEYLN